jgi:hypothetical protein
MTTAVVDSPPRLGRLVSRWIPDPTGQTGLISVWVPLTPADVSAPGLVP